MTKLPRHLPGSVRRARARYLAAALTAAVLVSCARVGTGASGAPAPREPVRETLAATASTPTSADTASRCPRTPGQEVLELINQRRAKAGLLPLKVDSRLVAAARAHAEDMARGAPFGHMGSDGTEPKDRVLREGYHYLETGENVAAGMPSAAEVVTDWMGSKPHRDNILSGYEDTGIAYVHMRFSVYGTYWVQVFGTPRPGQAPERLACNP